MRNAYKILVRRSESKREVSRPKCRWGCGLYSSGSG